MYTQATGIIRITAPNIATVDSSATRAGRGVDDALGVLEQVLLAGGHRLREALHREDALQVRGDLVEHHDATANTR
jgi:hypothetical protein